jgi:hypothetical protein
MLDMSFHFRYYYIDIMGRGHVADALGIFIFVTLPGARPYSADRHSWTGAGPPQLQEGFIMKRSIMLAIGMSFLLAATLAASSAQIDVRNSCGDTLWSNAAASVDIWIANDTYVCGLQFPISLSSADGVVWQWNSQPTGWGASRYVTHNPDGRIAKPTSVQANFDLTSGILVNENYLPDSIFMGAGCMGIGPGPGPLEHWLSIHFTPSASTDDQTYQLCLDLTQTIGNRFEFSLNDWGQEYDVTFLDDNGDGVWCWPVVAYIPGDANGDRLVNIGDAVCIINRIFRDGAPFNPTEAADANCDGSVNVGDAVYLVNHIFRGGPAPCSTWK